MEAVANIADMHINVPNLALEYKEAKLNVGQKRIFDKIKSHLINQKEREDLLENESSRLLRLDNIKPLRMFISGVGGTGKFLIEAIKCLVDDIWHPKSEHGGKTAGYWALNKEAQKRIEMTLKNLKL
uniref:Uncharacterized protein n=1 Tax=Amphimedon queenslandica TaxID=400682 RepID=A0A1X7TWR2_AMPQE